jgi:hypothetical protein
VPNCSYSRIGTIHSQDGSLLQVFGWGLFRLSSNSLEFAFKMLDSSTGDSAAAVGMSGSRLASPGTHNQHRYIPLLWC